MNFRTRHASLDPHPFRELKRRRQLWAICPDSTGDALKPEARIVPLETLEWAIVEIVRLRNVLFWVMFGAAVAGTALAAKLGSSLMMN